MAQQLKTVLGISIFTQPLVKTASNSAAVLCPVIIDMVNCKKFRNGFPAAGTFATVGFKNLITKFIAALLCLSKIVFRFSSIAFIGSFPTFITHAPIRMRALAAFNTQSRKSIPLTDFLGVCGTTFSMFCRPFRTLQLFLIPVLIQTRIANKCLFTLNVATRFTTIAKTIRSTSTCTEVFRRSGFKFFASRAMFLWGIALGYNSIHDRSNLSVIGQECSQHCLTPHYYPHIIPRSRSTSNFMPIVFCKKGEIVCLHQVRRGVA